MRNTKIDWCDDTVNPVVGCSNNCPYCYAKKLNARFKWAADFTKPVYFPERLKELECQTPKTIFVNSMSDISQWTGRQLLDLSTAVGENPQHHYIALTKDCSLYCNKLTALDMRHQSINSLLDLYLCVTVTCQNDIDRLGFVFNCCCVNIEPILSPINLTKIFKQIKMMPSSVRRKLQQVIIGAETGNRRNRVVAKREWVDDITNQCDAYGVRVYMKENLRAIMLNDFRQDKLIWAFK